MPYLIERVPHGWAVVRLSGQGKVRLSRHSTEGQAEKAKARREGRDAEIHDGIKLVRSQRSFADVQKERQRKGIR